MSQRAIGALVGLSAALAARPVALNDTGKKRAFYEDERSTYPKPGTITPAETPENLGQSYVLEGVTVRTTGVVQSAIQSVRESVTGTFACAESWLNSTKSRYIESERSVTDTFSSLHDKKEDLLPNGIYIAVAALSGNIFARNRGVVARFFAPTILGLASFRYFLPHTFSNTVGLLWSVEKRTLPEVAQHQVSAYNKAESWVKDVEKSAVSGQEKVSSGIDSARRKLASATGLNLDEDVSKK
ncbi:hypothetical protein FT663_04985 [Candidozyma haemuli var. vulneris]|uniref:MICOS complex subunit n=1 Tax=Candidozyma haemuli TaxID=45357 RepID=A0A2V1AY07_9ASCO|nr:hypothetical protein CXQ85_005384 [[Candida] haemuloni]KAF3986207.1 hypothetical protein FT663_04985 [[Candida] haemuloni var. vulneris]KAF3987512.1 hypothetical protein FT662_03945 [[Candida] haemuloni var. vulneris]PVH22702.1 hypothetical protein CXQ85_005384 [[Candida] haemuloni]